MSDAPDPYPESTKLHEIAHLSQACGEFIDWLASEHGIQLCEIPKGYSDTWFPSHRSLHGLLAEHFEIDMNKVDAERRAMITALRAANT
jgi:hypothetical protein